MSQAPATDGRTIGRYRVKKHLASGGMAEIYLASYDERGEERPAVVKVILRERAQDRKFIQMFLDEARVSSTFVHPNIAQLYEVGRDRDTYFYAMELVHGDNVRALIERSLRAKLRMPLAVTLAIGTRVAAALHYAHEKPSATGQHLNTVHRDVTPSNVMLGFDGGVKLLDFGIASADSRAQMTQSGTVKGKFAYMSPEQCKGEKVDRRTDVFALGIVLYELSVQRRAFRAETDFETMDRIIHGELVPPRMIHADYPRDLEAILLKALATDPAARYQTAAELGQALAGFQQAHGLPTGTEPIVEIMRRLFPAEAPALAPGLDDAPAIEIVPPVVAAPAPPPMSLASMLAATVEPQPIAPAAAPIGAVPAPPRPPASRVMRSPTGAVRAIAAAAPAPVAMTNAAPATVEPAAALDGLSSAAYATSYPASYPPSYTASAQGTPPAMAVVAAEDAAPLAFAQHSGSIAIPPEPAHAAPTGFTPPGAWPAVPPVAVPVAELEPLRAHRPTPVAFEPEEKSHLGLWVALAAVFAVGGVVAAVMVLSSLGFF